MLIVLVILILFLLGLLAGAISYTVIPTKGAKIGKYPSPQKALLVIDIQEDYTGTAAKPPFPLPDSEKLITVANKLIESASKNNVVVVYIKQEFSGFWGMIFSRAFTKSTGRKGTPGAEIDKRISLVSNYIFPKPKGDAFANPELESFLIKNQINELYLVGLDAEYCVYSTARGALNRGYTVNIITDSVLWDGHILQTDEKRDKLIKKYKESGIVLRSSGEFLQKNP
ncbi:MAG: cysteine hydrolase [bacterium]|nr:cysteine hydrolase [bacterium]